MIKPPPTPDELDHSTLPPGWWVAAAGVAAFCCFLIGVLVGLRMGSSPPHESADRHASAPADDRVGEWKPTGDGATVIHTLTGEIRSARTGETIAD